MLRWDLNASRRRKKDSVVIPINGNIESESNVAKQSQCRLFSMTFPRYKIRLTSSTPTSSSLKGITKAEERRTRRVEQGIITKLVQKSNNWDKDEKSKTKQNYKGRGENNGNSLSIPLWMGTTEKQWKHYISKKQRKDYFDGSNHPLLLLRMQRWICRV